MVHQCFNEKIISDSKYVERISETLNGCHHPIHPTIGILFLIAY